MAEPLHVVRESDDGDGHDAAWFDGVFTQHATAVHRYFLRRAARSDVDDLVAEVFTTAWRRRDTVPDGAELPWLYRTAGYLLANHRRKAAPEPVADLDSVHGVLVDDDGPERQGQRAQEARTALSSLSPRDREVLVLVAWEGLGREDLAAVLGISVGGADAALSRARARLLRIWSHSS